MTIEDITVAIPVSRVPLKLNTTVLSLSGSQAKIDRIGKVEQNVHRNGRANYSGCDASKCSRDLNDLIPAATVLGYEWVVRGMSSQKKAIPISCWTFQWFR